MVNSESKERLVTLIKNKVFRGIDSTFKDEVKRLMTKKGKYTTVEYLNILSGIVDINTLPIEELLWFAQAIEKASKNKGKCICRTRDYFTEHEINNFKYYSRDKSSKKDLFVLQNAVRIGENQYSCVVSLYQLALMKRFDIIRAIPEVQRESKEIRNKRTGDVILREIATYSSKINSIKEKIINREYNYDDIALNLIDDGENEFIFDEDERTITLPVDGETIILDGNNRCIAVERAYTDSSELEDLFKTDCFPIIFTFYNIDKAKSCVHQKWLATPPKQNQKKAMERTNANFIVDEIKRSTQAEPIYSKKIVNTGREVLMKTGFIIYGVLSDAIEDYYSINKKPLKKQSKLVADWLIEFFNYLSEILTDDFVNYQKPYVKNEKWSTHPYTWVGYVCLSKKLQGVENWQEKLERIVNSIDWSRENSPFEGKRQFAYPKLAKEFFENIIEREGV